MNTYLSLNPVLSPMLYFLFHYPGEMDCSRKDKICLNSLTGDAGVVSLSEEFVEASMTIRFVVLFFECALVELFEAEGAYKMLWMILAEHCSDAASCDGLAAPSAQ